MFIIYSTYNFYLWTIIPSFYRNEKGIYHWIILLKKKLKKLKIIKKKKKTELEKRDKNIS